MLGLLLPFPAQEDKAAETLYRAMCGRIDEAKTLQVEFGVGVNRGGRKLAFLSGKMKASGADRWTLDLQLNPSFRDDRLEQTRLRSDGRKVVTLGGRQNVPGVDLKPAEVGTKIRQACSVSTVELTVLAAPALYGGRPLVQKVAGPFKSGGKARIGARDAVIVEHMVKIEGLGGDEKEFHGQLWLDAETKLPLQRMLELDGTSWTETFTTFAVDASVPDAEFRFQSGTRLARARAAQLAESARLYGAFTGRNLRSLDELLARP